MKEQVKNARAVDSWEVPCPHPVPRSPRPGGRPHCPGQGGLDASGPSVPVPGVPFHSSAVSCSEPRGPGEIFTVPVRARGRGGGNAGERGCEDGPPSELPRRPCHLSHPDCGLLPHRREERPKGQQGVAKRGRTQDSGPGSARPLHQLGDLGQELTAGV